MQISILADWWIPLLWGCLWTILGPLPVTPWRYNSSRRTLVPGMFCNSRNCLSPIERRWQLTLDLQLKITVTYS